MEDIMVISVVGYLKYAPRDRNVKGGEYTYFCLTSDPDGQDSRRTTFIVQVHDTELRKYVNTHLQKGMKVYVTGEYGESFSIIAGTLLSNQKIKAYGVEIVRAKQSVHL